MYLHPLIAGSVNSNYTLHIWFTVLFHMPFLARELTAHQIYYLHVSTANTSEETLSETSMFICSTGEQCLLSLPVS